MQDDRVWLWAGFVPPGSHSVQVLDPIFGMVKDKFFVTPREVEI